MTREAITVGFDAGDGFLGRCRGSDITRFRCGGRRFVTLGHPDYVDRVLYQARLRYVKSNEYEPVRARRRFLRRRHMNHTSSVGDRSTRSTRTPVARTTMSYRQTQPLVPSFRLKSANFRLRKAKGLFMQRHAL